VLGVPSEEVRCLEESHYVVPLVSLRKEDEETRGCCLLVMYMWSCHQQKDPLDVSCCLRFATSKSDVALHRRLAPGDFEGSSCDFLQISSAFERNLRDTSGIKFEILGTRIRRRNSTWSTRNDDDDARLQAIY
jgi:hypothetical protein